MVTDKISSDPLKCTHTTVPCYSTGYCRIRPQPGAQCLPYMEGAELRIHKEGTELSSCTVLKDSTNTQYPHKHCKGCMGWSIHNIKG